jgi:hypothetical protein
MLPAAATPSISEEQVQPALPVPCSAEHADASSTNAPPVSSKPAEVSIGNTELTPPAAANPALAAASTVKDDQAQTALSRQAPLAPVTGPDAKSSTAPPVSSKPADVSVGDTEVMLPATANPAPAVASTAKDDQAPPALSRQDGPAHVTGAGAESSAAPPVASKSAAASSDDATSARPASADPAPASTTQHIDPSAFGQSAPILSSPAATAPTVAVTNPEPSTAAAAAPTTTQPSHASSPAAQVAPALVQFAHTAESGQRLTIRLEPPELGHVEVRIDRPHELPAHVEITVEKTETLMLLLRDQPQLQRTLDQAGVPPEGRSVTFHVALAEQRSAEPSTAPAPGVAAGGTWGDASQGAPRNQGKAKQQQAGATEGGETGLVAASFNGWARAGLDITA